MGKKKPKPDATQQKDRVREPKVQKNYSFASETKAQKKAPTTAANVDDGDALLKVQLPADKEAAVIAMILEYQERQRASGSASFRLTKKKLTDLYTCLARTGFKHSQIESAMASTVQYGGDLEDALDWLCLNTHNDQLPARFSQTLSAEEKKKKPRFTGEQDSDIPMATTSSGREITLPLTRNPDESAAVSVDPKKSMKDWILQYAEVEGDENEDNVPAEATRKVTDPTERYLELTAKFLDAKSTASEAKKQGDKGVVREISKRIREYVQEMNALETQPEFNPAVKLCDMEAEKSDEAMEVPVGPVSVLNESVPRTKGPQVSENRGCRDGASKDDRDDFVSSGFGMFEEPASSSPPKPKPKAKPAKVQLEKRDFAYTRQQWTGKSPKQFLIDWVRKNLPKSPPPSYSKVNEGHGLWRSRCKVVTVRDGPLQVCPDIVCENVKDAEHLASVLLLYTLCKGQRIYQLLPPPYRDVWLIWQDAENKHKEDAKAEENKPRDQLISKLMKNLKVEGGKQNSPGPDEEEELEETWEDLLSDEESDSQDEAELKASSPPRAQPGRSALGRVAPPSQLRRLLLENRSSQVYQDLVAARRDLPVSQHREAIIHSIQSNNVVMVAGETGSGKSTQIPQFILEDLLMAEQHCNIVCTEPRRISATSLASRVSEELGEQDGPGSRGTLCGYQIRFEAKRCDTTRLLYCTTGVLLRKLQQDPLIADITHVVVDEVHERSVQSDFLLIILTQLLQKRPNFHVVLMSATLDAGKFSAYFNHCPVINIPGRTYPVQVFHIEDVIEKTGYKLEEDSIYSRRYHDLIEEERDTVQVTGKGGDVANVQVAWSKEDIATIDKSGLDPESYSLSTRNSVTRLNPDRINMELVVELLHYLDQEPEFQAVKGAVLIFMPGLSHIQELYENMKCDRHFSDRTRYRIVPLHSTFSSQDQKLAFSVPPAGVRKVVIATNIAETGITIPDVVFVIDSGKAKENRYIESSQMSTLDEVFVSKANAKQRQGRAGRVQAGHCFRLFTYLKFQAMKAYSVPEILRVPLEELCLHIMKCDRGHPADFLAQALDPPQAVSIRKAMDILREVGACDPLTPTLTPLGHHLAALPVNVKIGKMLIYSAILGCLEPMAVMAASMMDKSPFAVPMGKRAEADLARNSLAFENSDHLTLYKAFIGWKRSQKDGRAAEAQYCDKYFMKRNTLMDIQNVANDLVKLVRSTGFQDLSLNRAGSVPKKEPMPAVGDVIAISQSDSSLTFRVELSPNVVAVLKTILTAGLYPNVAYVSYTPKVDSVANPERQACVALTRHGPVNAHPSSVNRFLAANGWLIYHEKVKLKKIHLRDSTLVSPFPILLFGGSLSVQHNEQVISVDDWIRFKAFAKTAVIFKELRVLIEDLLKRKLEDPGLNLADEPVVRLLLELITSERRR